MIKISDFSAALQNLAAVHGEEEIVSVGAVNGQIGGLENPFVIHTWNDGIYYLPSEAVRRRFTIEKTLSHQAVKKLRKWLDPDTPSDQLPKNAFTRPASLLFIHFLGAFSSLSNRSIASLDISFAGIILAI